MTYRILRTSETAPYDMPLQPAEVATQGRKRFIGFGDTFRGTSRKAAKLSIADAEIETFEDIKDLIETLPADQSMISHQPSITNEPESGRVDEENRNVRVRAFLYAARREPQNDFYLFVGRDLAHDHGAMYMQTVISGLPPQDSKHFSRLKAAREAYKEFFNEDLPGASYDFYEPPIPVEVEGSLFFEMGHGAKPGPAAIRPNIPTLWEIHPITNNLFTIQREVGAD